MTQYQATQQLHETVQSKSKELGLKSVDVYNFSIFCGIKSYLIQEPQLKQIFVAFEEKLGENPNYRLKIKTPKRKLNIESNLMMGLNLQESISSSLSEEWDYISIHPKSLAEALYRKYCYDYPESGFKKDPVKALLEVNEIIKNLK